MLDPKLANKQSPETFKAKFVTTKGDFVIKVTRNWAPKGADRFYNLVDIGYFKDVVIFRGIQGFMFQFGIHGDPVVNRAWKDADIRDDPDAKVSNRPGYITFANGGPNTRSNQLFINLGDNARLDAMGFRPIGQVVEGADVVLKINTEYGENADGDQGSFQARGNSYILQKYPRLDVIKNVVLVTDDPADASPAAGQTETNKP
jgi:peptidyl-prolyl cis-trans isomerase A (cyclophilin A)